MVVLVTDKSKKQEKDWRVLEFVVPIKEAVTDNDNFIIRGVAINETTTLNNVKYVAEELEKAAPSFRNVPILLDHRNEIKSIVGRTTENVNFNSSFHRIDFEAKIMDNDIKEMIKDGRIGSVSIGAKVQDLTEEEDGSMKAIGIHGLEISLVAVPGDSQANLAQAIQRGLHLKEMAITNKEKENVKLDKKINIKEEDKMAEDEEKTEEETPKAEEVPIEAPAEEVKPEEAPAEKPAEGEVVTEEKVQKIDVKIDTTELTEMKKQISELKDLLKEKKAIKDSVKEDATKGEVKAKKVEAIEKLNDTILEKASSGYAIYKDYSKLDADTKLKRLVR